MPLTDDKLLVLADDEASVKSCSSNTAVAGSVQCLPLIAAAAAGRRCCSRWQHRYHHPRGLESVVILLSGPASRSHRGERWQVAGRRQSATAKNSLHWTKTLRQIELTTDVVRTPSIIIRRWNWKPTNRLAADDSNGVTNVLTVCIGGRCMQYIHKTHRSIDTVHCKVTSPAAGRLLSLPLGYVCWL